VSEQPLTFGAPRNLEPVDSVLECIGWTPLIRLSRVARGVRMPVYAKAEYLNPGQSVKDRIGLAMIEAAERSGQLKPGGTVVEATGGNTGVALAMVCAIKGYRCIFTMPDKMSMEKVRLLKAFGAQVVITPTAVPPDSPEHYIQAAKAIAKKTPGAFLTNQFYNRTNVDCHHATTGPEIWQQTKGRVRALVAGAGTGGTISGAGRYLKEQDERVRTVVADPVGSVYRQYRETGKLGTGSPYLVEGIGGDKIPETMDFEYIDEVRQVTDQDSFTMARRLAREEGIFAGGSSGTMVEVALQVARDLDDPDGCVVTLLGDSGDRYLSKAHDDEWMRQNRFLDVDAMSVRALLDRKGAMSTSVIHAKGDAPVRRALELMQKHGITQLPVIDDGECVGSVSESKLLQRALQDLKSLDAPLTTIMEAPFPAVSGRDSFDHVTKLLARGNDGVLVRDAGTFVGFITRSDVLDFMKG
jgi:cystathionine beta-synthase